MNFSVLQTEAKKLNFVQHLLLTLKPVRNLKTVRETFQMFSFFKENLNLDMTEIQAQVN